MGNQMHALIKDLLLIPTYINRNKFYSNRTVSHIIKGSKTTDQNIAKYNSEQKKIYENFNR